MENPAQKKSAALALIVVAALVGTLAFGLVVAPGATTDETAAPLVSSSVDEPGLAWEKREALREARAAPGMDEGAQASPAEVERADVERDHREAVREMDG